MAYNKNIISWQAMDELWRTIEKPMLRLRCERQLATSSGGAKSL